MSETVDLASRLRSTRGPGWRWKMAGLLSSRTELPNHVKSDSAFAAAWEFLKLPAGNDCVEPALQNVADAHALFTKRLFQKPSSGSLLGIGETLSSRVCGQATEHQMNHGNLDHRGARVGSLLAVFVQASAAPQPS